MGSFQEWDFLDDLNPSKGKNHMNGNNHGFSNNAILTANPQTNGGGNNNNNYNHFYSSNPFENGPSSNNSSRSSSNGNLSSYLPNGNGNGFSNNDLFSTINNNNNNNNNIFIDPLQQPQPSSPPLSSIPNSHSNGSLNGISNGTTQTVDDEGFIIHTLTPQDTLIGLSVKYGVKVEEIKRVNKIRQESSLFLKKNLKIPKIDEAGQTTSNNNNNNNTNNNNNQIEYNHNTKSQRKSINGKQYDEFDHNNMFPEFERMSTSFGNKPKPSLPEYKSFPNNYGNENTNWRSVPVSTFSMSPVVTSLDQKTQNQFSLLDEEFNPL